MFVFNELGNYIHLLREQSIWGANEKFQKFHLTLFISKNKP